MTMTHVLIPIKDIDERINDLKRQGEVADKEKCFEDVRQIVFEIAAIQETLRRGKQISLDEMDIEDSDINGKAFDYSKSVTNITNHPLEARIKSSTWKEGYKQALKDLS